MLSFLRNNSIKIVYGIIISFVVTTFMGVVFFNDSFKTSKDVQQRQLDRQWLRYLLPYSQKFLRIR